MADRPLTALLSYHCLTGPLSRNPTDEIDRTINRLCLKYRSYTIDYEVDCGAVMVPLSFGSDFGDQIGRYDVLVDKNHNEFELRVERINGNIYFTMGSAALRDLYGITFGAWVTVVFLGLGKFQIKKIRCRVMRKIHFPHFIPPVRFAIDRNVLPPSIQCVFSASVYELAFRLDPVMFAISCEKNLTIDDVNAGFLKLDGNGLAEQMLEKINGVLALIDDCGSKWEFIVVYESVPIKHFIIGGQWKRMIEARRFQQGDYIKIGAPGPGNNKTLFLSRKLVL